MPIRPLLAAAVLLSSSAVVAKPPQYLIIDHSTEAGMDKASALATWKAQMDHKRVDRIAKLDPVGKWGFVSQVEGGFTPD